MDTQQKRAMHTFSDFDYVHPNEHGWIGSITKKAGLIVSGPNPVLFRYGFARASTPCPAEDCQEIE